jgi:hypothetical protein
MNLTQKRGQATSTNWKNNNRNQTKSLINFLQTHRSSTTFQRTPSKRQNSTPGLLNLVSKEM